jgi:acid phosphatase
MRMLIPALIVVLTAAAVAAEPDITKVRSFTDAAFAKLSPSEKAAYLAGLIDGLAQSSSVPASRARQVATCMKGFPIDRLEALASGVVPIAGMQPISPDTPAAVAIIARMAWYCQLQWTVPTAAHAADPSGRLPRPDHVVIVVEASKSYEQVIGSAAAPYINRLANGGALFTNAYAIAHPSQPNYLALFSGSTHGVIDDGCPLRLAGENLSSALAKQSLSFGIYSESMPSTGFEGCVSSKNFYVRKNNPAVNWQGINVPHAVNMPFDSFPSDFSKLPTVSMVVPNQINDMHDAPSPSAAVMQGDAWLKSHIDAYVQWAVTHNSLLIVTWDEDDGSGNNHIPTIFVGPMVKRGSYGARVDHYSVLRTIAEMYDLPPPGKAADIAPIGGVWTAGEQRQ